MGIISKWMCVYRWGSMGALLGLYVLAMLDKFNSHTFPIYGYLIYISVLAAVAVVNAAFMSVSILGIPRTFSAFANTLGLTPQQRDSTTAALMGKGTKGKGMAGASQSVLEAMYHSMRTMSMINIAYVLSMALGSIMMGIYVLWIYTYTKNSPGYQTALDQGFPRAEAATYVMQAKREMISWTEITLFVTAILHGCQTLGGVIYRVPKEA